MFNRECQSSLCSYMNANPHIEWNYRLFVNAIARYALIWIPMPACDAIGLAELRNRHMVTHLTSKCCIQIHNSTVVYHTITVLIQELPIRNSINTLCFRKYDQSEAPLAEAVTSSVHAIVAFDDTLISFIFSVVVFRKWIDVTLFQINLKDPSLFSRTLKSNIEREKK
jgi:hypothetical protein